MISCVESDSGLSCRKNSVLFIYLVITILEDNHEWIFYFISRPSNLPAKCFEEALRHKQEHARMVEAARRRVEREAAARHARVQESLRLEERLARHAREWTVSILPEWHKM